MIRKVVRRKRRVSDNGVLEGWVDFWVRTGRIAWQHWASSARPTWSECVLRRQWHWAQTIACEPDSSLLRRLMSWKCMVAGAEQDLRLP
eukprot:12132810-Heterocapsa_arctica.AAC.1